MKPHINLALVCASIVFFGCAASPEKDAETSGVLVPVTATDPAAPNPISNPNYEKLNTQLNALGYEGIGMQFESDEVLQLLLQVFAHPKTKNRQLKSIYMGFDMSYDSGAKSLTIGKLKTAAEIVSFIQKIVPLNR